MKTPYVFENGENSYTVEDVVEMYALRIGESILKNEKRVEDIMQDCKILNSLSNALLAIKK